MRPILFYITLLHFFTFSKMAFTLYDSTLRGDYFYFFCGGVILVSFVHRILTKQFQTKKRYTSDSGKRRCSLNFWNKICLAQLPNTLREHEITNYFANWNIAFSKLWQLPFFDFPQLPNLKCNFHEELGWNKEGIQITDIVTGSIILIIEVI